MRPILRIAGIVAHRYQILRICTLGGARMHIPTIGPSRMLTITQVNHDEEKGAPIVKKLGKKQIATINLLVSLALYSFLFYFYLYKKKKGNSDISHLKVGGPFDLVDHNQNPFTDKNVKGKFCLFYFYFMNPSDNPSQPLEKIKDIMSYFSSRYVDRFLKCVFVWFDPEQKSPQLTNEFIDDLHVPVIGLTGTKEQIDQLKKSFRLDGDCQLEVAQQKHENHSNSIYLVGPDCFVWRIFSMNDDIMAIVQDIQLSIHQYTEKKLDAIKS